MLTEEAFHLFVGETGMERIIMRSAELEKIDPNGDIRAQGGIDFGIIQRTINYWLSNCLDLFGGEISNNAARYFAAGLKGRFREEERYEDHRAVEDSYSIPVVEQGRLTVKEVPLRNAMNELLSDDYIRDCQRALDKWNRRLADFGSETRPRCPAAGSIASRGSTATSRSTPRASSSRRRKFEKNRESWLLSPSDNAYLQQIMVPVREPGAFAQWIRPPAKGLGGKGIDFEYVRA